MNLESIAQIVATFTGGILSGICIYGFFHEKKVIEWEYKHIWNPLKRKIRSKLIKNKRFMAWLNAPAKHGKPDEDWITGQVKVFGDDMWR